MVPRPEHGLSLCAGGGGLDMGLGLAEPGFHTRCYVEWEEYPRSVLIAAQEAGYIAPAPIWDDLTTFDARPFAGAFDTLLAGYPCQPFSAAGQRKGADDERHLWPDVARVARELGPGLNWIFLENVAGHVSLGLETVLRDLREMGFTPAAGLFTAAETGAAHERERVFIVAFREGRDADDGRPLADSRRDKHVEIARDRRQERQVSGWERAEHRSHVSDGCGRELAHAESLVGWREQPAGGAGRGRAGFAGGGADLADPSRLDRPLHPGQGTEGCGAPDAGRAEPDVGHAPRLGCGEGRAEPEFRSRWNAATGPDGTMERPSGVGLADAIGSARHEGGAGISGGSYRAGFAREAIGTGGFRPLLHAPGPADMDLWRFTLDLAPDLAPALSLGHVVGVADRAAQMVAQGHMAEAAAESLVRRMADVLAARSRGLRLLGNGVHPLAAAHAWRTLSAAHGLWPVDLGAAIGSGCAGTDELVGVTG